MQSQESMPAPLEASKERKKNEEMELNASFVVKVISPAAKKKTVPFKPLNTDNPEDRAMALVLRLAQQRKERQHRQFKLLEQIRSRQSIDISKIGHVSRIIDKQNFIANNQFLRENHYRTASIPMAKPLQSSRQLLPPTQRKNQLRRELEVLQKSKILSLRHEGRKIILQILEQVIFKSVDIYHRKKRFYFGSPPSRISEMMAKSDRFGCSLSDRRKSLDFSRVLDISINNEQKSEDEEKEEDDSSNEHEDSNSDDSKSDEDNSNDESDQSDEEGQKPETEDNDASGEDSQEKNEQNQVSASQSKQQSS